MNNFDETRVSNTLYSGIIARIMVMIKWLIKGCHFYLRSKEDREIISVIV
ncbi:MAG: hypothetical protein AB9834_12865 [Lentimicrobium sp.]